MAQGLAHYGYAEHLLPVIGTIELVSSLLCLIPRTSVLGAILLTGLFGGAIATNVRVGDPSFVVPLILGILVWTGLFSRDERLRPLIPLRS